MGMSALKRSWVGFIVVCLLAVAMQAQNSITTVAGGGPTGVAATSAAIGFPAGIARYSGIAYFSDSLSARIFKVDAGGNLTIVVGDIVAGNTGDYDPANPNPQPATLASLNGPQSIAVDSTGNVYIADTNSNAIRVLNNGSGILTIAGAQIGPGSIGTVVGCLFPPNQCSTTDNTPAQNVLLNGPKGVAVDGAGNIYIADTADHVIRVVNVGSTPIQIGAIQVPAGDIATVAGTFAQFGSTDGVQANNALLSSPAGVSVDASGYIYVADTGNSEIRVVNPTAAAITVTNVSIAAGFIQTVAGEPPPNNTCTPSGNAPFCGDTGQGIGAGAQLNFPTGVAADGSGNIFIADTKDQVVRKLASDGVIDDFAGNYTACLSAGQSCGDGGAATSAQLAAPAAVTVDGGNVYIADQNNDAIREVKADLSIVSVAGTLTQQQFYVQFFGDGAAATNAELYYPVAAATDNAGNVLIADSFNNVIRKVDAATGNISTFVGKAQTFCSTTPCGDGSDLSQAVLSFPSDVFIDKSGNTFIADYQPAIGGSPGLAVIREITGSTIKAVVGNYNSGPGYSGDGGSALNAQLGQGIYGNTPPLGAYVDKAGIIYVVDSLNHAIRAVNTTSSAVTVAGRNIAPGNIDTIAGNGTPGFSGDNGPARSAQLNNPLGVATDSAGNIYIADSVNHRIRKVTTGGTISTFAGTGNPCGQNSPPACGDGGLATSADLDLPSDVLVDYAGNVFLSDTGDFAVREVTTDGNIATVMGAQKRGFGGDGTGGLLVSPLGLSFDSLGNLYTADFFQWRIRKVSAIAATAPTATPNPTSLSFPGQTINTTSSSKAITVTNSGNITSLTISKVALTGTNAGDFAISSDKCTGTLVAGANCEIDVTFTPTATGNRTADVTITDNAPNNPQNIALSGTGTAAPDFVLPAPTPGTQTVTAGSAATYTVSVTAQNGFNNAVTLSCSAGVPPGAACSFVPASITPGQNSTLTITTSAAKAALERPAKGRQSFFYAIWLLLPAMVLSTAGIAAPRRKKLLSWLLLALAVSGLLFLVACGGGGSSSGGGGGGGGGTPPNSYTITIQGAAQGFTSQTTQVTLVVQ